MTVFKFVVKSVVTVKYLFEPVQAPVMLHAIVTFAPDIPQILAWASGGALSKGLSVLLASASFGGTIAAVRHLAKHNIDVGVVSSHRLGAAAWSRHVARSYSAPPESESQRFLERLACDWCGRSWPDTVADIGRNRLDVCRERRATGSAFLHVSTVDYDPAAHPGQEAFCGCCDQTPALRCCRVGIRETLTMSRSWRRPYPILSL